MGLNDAAVLNQLASTGTETVLENTHGPRAELRGSTEPKERRRKCHRGRGVFWSKNQRLGFKVGVIIRCDIQEGGQAK